MRNPCINITADYDTVLNCDLYGMAGRCGINCPVYLDGSCEYAEEVLAFPTVLLWEIQTKDKNKSPVNWKKTGF